VVRYPVDLRASINTDTLDQDVKPIGSGPSRVNTGIERDGGLTNLYRQDTAVTANATTIVTDSGKVLQVGPIAANVAPISFDGVQIGACAGYAVTGRNEYKNYSDACVSATGTILLCRLLNPATRQVVFEERAASTGALLNSRTILMPGGIPAERIFMVRSSVMAYVNPLELVMASTSGGLVANVRYSIEGGAGSITGMPVANFQGNIYAYKYEAANQYLLLSLGDGIAGVGNLAGGAGAIAASFVCSYAARQTSGGFTRHIITKPPALAAGLVQMVGIVGHNAFAAAFTAAPAWQTPLGMAAGSISSIYRVGFGSAESFYTQAGTRAFATPEFAAFFRDYASGETVIHDYFGLVSGNNTAAPPSSKHIRLIGINGVMSHFSFCQNTYNYRGVIISPVGELDPSFQPEVKDTGGTSINTLVYKYNGAFYTIALGAPSVIEVGKIARNIYRINTLDPYNTVDVDAGRVRIGGDDFNGRCVHYNLGGAAPATYAFKVETAFGTTVDAGELTTSDIGGTPETDTYYAEMPLPLYGPGDLYGQDLYINGIYARTMLANGAYVVDSAKKDTVYVPSTTLPIAAGALYDDNSAVVLSESFLRVDRRDEYLIGNRIQGAYDFFRLFGNLYAYNEGTIYLVPLSASGFVQTLQPFATGQALQLIATAPTMIYFLSTWDNSLYSFDGGRALVKGVRMNQLPAIIKGEWNVAENSLTLDTASSFIFVRDGVVSSVAKNADQVAGVALWSADDGVHIVGTASRYKYNYNAVGTVQPLAYRSAFFGLDATKQAYLSQAVFTIYSPTRAQVVLKLIAEAFDMDDYFYQDEEITVYPGDYSAAGYFRARSQPGQMRGLGAAIGIECASKIVVLDAAVEVNETAPGTVAAKGSV
jgi:hypothetical protein